MINDNGTATPSATPGPGEPTSSKTELWLEVKMLSAIILLA